MQYFIYLGSLKILLPSEYSLQERIDYVDDLITSHEQYFRFLLASTKENYAADLVEHRLSTLASYILAADKKDAEYTVQTYYGERKAKLHEPNFSNYE